MIRNFWMTVMACLIVCSSFGLSAKGLKKVSPKSVGMDVERLQKVDGLIEEAVDEGVIPGMVLAVVRGDKLAYLKAYGNKSVYPDTVPMTTDVVFDLASCSKVVGTTMSMMHLLESGGYRLADKVSQYIPGFEPYTDPETGKTTDIRIVDLLTHTSGLPAYASVDKVLETYGKADPDSLMSYICKMPRGFKPATAYRYSCLNFITLQHILQRITGERLCDYAQKNIFDKLGMEHTTYCPKAFGKTEIMKLVAPTSVQEDGSVLLGETHDPLARVLNFGNSGNAGVFSSAEDLAVLCAALLNGGEVNGRRVLGKLTVDAMLREPEEVKGIGHTLGWVSYTQNTMNLLNPEFTVGHTGYTGTQILIDPVSDVAIIMLAHRVHPVDKGNLAPLRGKVANIVAGSIVK